MKKIFSDLYAGLNGSLKNGDGGYSSKKLTALAIVLCVVAVHIKWMNTNDFSLMPTILGIDFGFIALLYGINVTDKKLNPEPKNETPV